MRLALRSSLAICMIFCKRWGCLVCQETSSAVAALPMEEMGGLARASTPVGNGSTCGEWASWAPPRSHPALVLQIVNEAYADMQRNFMRLMELNSIFTRQHLYLMCMDDASVQIVASLGVRCVPLGALTFNSIEDVWKTRVQALSCLVMEGYNVIMSDADALWLRDPMDYFGLPGVRSSSVVASRGNLPFNLSDRWGATMCLGFILFRATGPGMHMLQRSMQALVLRLGDDQIAANQAISRFGVIWDEDSDMRLYNSTGLGRGTIEILVGEKGPFVITLLPHSAFTRQCGHTPLSSETVVAHCHSRKHVGKRISWMKEANLWSLDLQG